MIREIKIQDRPVNADHWDPGITHVLEGYDSKDQAIRYVMAKAQETAAKYHSEQEKKKRLENADRT